MVVAGDTMRARSCPVAVSNANCWSARRTGSMAYAGDAGAPPLNELAWRADLVLRYAEGLATGM